MITAGKRPVDSSIRIASTYLQIPDPQRSPSDPPEPPRHRLESLRTWIAILSGTLNIVERAVRYLPKILEAVEDWLRGMFLRRRPT